MAANVIYIFGVVVVFFVLPLEMQSSKRERERERACLKMAHIIFGCHELPRDQFVSINVKVRMNNTRRNCIYFMRRMIAVVVVGAGYLFYILCFDE